MSGGLRLAVKGGAGAGRGAAAVLAAVLAASPAHAAAPEAPAVTSRPARPDPPECEVIHGLTDLGKEHRARLHQACVEGPKPEAETYRAVFRLVSAGGWHAGVLGRILGRHGHERFTAFADGGSHPTPGAVATQAILEEAWPEFAAGRLCAEQRQSEEMAEFLDAVGADEPPETQPFGTRFATCLGVPPAQLEGTRLLTIRADGLDEVTVVMGTRDFVHARRFRRDDAMALGSHRFFVVAVPEASPVVVHAEHENQELPVVWHGLVGRNELVWGVPPRRSCVDLSVNMDRGTHLFIDGVRVDRGASAAPVCPGPDASSRRPEAVDRTITITLDHATARLPDHEVAALVCDEGKPVVRHLSPIAATRPAQELRREGECETLRLDLGTPARQRVAVLGVTKLPSCEASPLWASDLPERIRHVLGSDAAHRETRSYANFSAYAEASEALSSLQTKLGGADTESPERGADPNALLGTAAQEAWRQGIDTLLSFGLQCTPRGKDERGEPQWSYSMRVTSIRVSELFARGYYGREGLDLEDFIEVENVGFSSARQQDAAIGALLDRVFAVETPRFDAPPGRAPYREGQRLRLSGYFDETSDPPEDVVVRYKAFPITRRGPQRGEAPTALSLGKVERPPACDGLAHRGARRQEALEVAGRVWDELPAEAQPITLRRSQDELDLGSNPQAAVHQGLMRPRRPGWYLVAVEGPDETLQDAVCINATAPPVDLFAQVTASGGPLALALNGSKAVLYLRPRLGVTWYGSRRWLGGGWSLGYGSTLYSGSRSDWKDLEVSETDPLRWQRHALLLGPHGELRSRLTTLPGEFRVRVTAALDAGLVAIRGIDDDLVEFRAGNEDDVVLDIDLDLGLDLIAGVPLGPIQLEGILALSYVAVDDSLRRSSTAVNQDSNLFVGFGLGVSGGRKPGGSR